MPINKKQEGDCGYIAHFEGMRIELYAPSLYSAKLAAVDHFRPSKRKAGLLSVMIAEDRDGNVVTHTPSF